MFYPPSIALFPFHPESNMTIIAVVVAFCAGVFVGTVEGPKVWLWLWTKSPAKVLSEAKAIVAAEDARLAALIAAKAVVASAPVVAAPVAAPAPPAA